MNPLVIHAHLYQPPRENPWTGAVERESSAHPDHDWNERINRECYRANAFARVFEHSGRVERIFNNYEWLSFNVGPTLLSWLEEHDPETLARIVAADRASAARNDGHGNAIAQGYNHAILPLCSERDQRTQIRWGIADFRHRFGRAPESLWLPETACNHATLGALIDEGLAYVILSPHQAERVRRRGDPIWTDVSSGNVDPGQAYEYRHRDGSGRTIAIFFYDGPISRSIAFEGILSSSQAFVGRMRQADGGPRRLVHVATDGESYGHHTKYGERALAYALLHEAPARGFRVTNYGAFLASHPPKLEAEIKDGPNGEGTAWSCAHGVGRWYRDCGCSTGARDGWNQRWRGPLRAALDVVRDEAAARFEETRGVLFEDPWRARDAYIDLVLRRDGSKEEWLTRHAGRALSPAERERALTHLELQRAALMMYTSCGWFFADISGIETVQVMKYAERALEHMEDLRIEAPRERFLERLAEARSNLPEMGSGADVFRRFVEPSRVSPGRVAANVALSSLVEDALPATLASGHHFRTSDVKKQKHGRLVMVTTRVELEDRATDRRLDFAVAAMHFGGADFYCVARPFVDAHRFRTATTRLWSSFKTGSLPTLLRIAQEELGPDEYALESLLPETRRRISDWVFGNIMGSFADQYAHLFETNERVLDMLQVAGLDLPPELMAAAVFTFTRRFEQAVRRANGSQDAAAYEPAVRIADEARRRGFEIDRTAVGPLMMQVLVDAARATAADPTPERIDAACALAGVVHRLGVWWSLERAQEILDAMVDARTADPKLRALRRAYELAAPPPEEAPEAAAAAASPSARPASSLHAG
jgi:alpha-amylase/alpha-mannosidase (GH57 family)